ncbi:hypothetical protein HYH03_003722 [Edaphochlamys debaryana]|uniref:Uncharacterized protein n=1 Tax=Edaphochlamys debaryana TaxID=47281 RepID=A0A835YIV6_9CHLO|nr:hypothetical protein HYH03_003722 [Edaphochlamys debaryana]|eukprot:KAG2498469.1 hypothetical protein HYH03_003722 [Edaphochlamys debaryana]
MGPPKGAAAAAKGAEPAVADPASIDVEVSSEKKDIGKGWRYRTLVPWYLRILFFDVDGLIYLGYRTRLEPEHMYQDPGVQTKHLYDQLEPAWEEQRKKPEPDLKIALLRGNVSQLVVTGILYLVSQACSLAGPLLLRRIVQGLQCEAAQRKIPVDIGCQPRGELYYYIIGLFLAPAIQTLCENQQMYLLYRLGTRMRNALMAAIYRKCLRLSNSALQAESTGRVVTLMSNDAQKLQDAMFAIHAMWGSPCYIIAVLTLLWFEVGWATFVGLGVMLAMVPATGTLAAKLGGLRREIMQWTDKRVGRMNELINGIQMIKFYAWESSFREAVLEARGQEARILRRTALWQGVFGLLLFYGPVAVALFCFGSWAIAGQTLTPAKAYTALALFSLLRFPMSFLPMLVTMIINAMIAIKRIGGFLQREETQMTQWDPKTTPAGNVLIKEGVFSWDAPPDPSKPAPPPEPVPKGGKPGPGGPGGKPAKGGPKGGKVADGKAEAGKEGGKEAPEPQPWAPSLSGINLSAKPGSLTMIVGGVGSGKSSVLSALVGQMGPPLEGQMALGGSVAYVAQSAWIMNDTLQENVLMGAPMDPTRYRSALEVSQLGPDLAILPNGDLTEIGDRGVTLSGGQKQRVSIARAVYANADVYLLDDPLSAVDSHVGRALFEQVIRGVLRDKTVLLVTNALQYLPHADNVIWMEDGRERAQGPFAALQEQGLNIAELCHDEADDMADEEAAKQPGSEPETPAKATSADKEKDVASPAKEGDDAGSASTSTTTTHSGLADAVVATVKDASSAAASPTPGVPGGKEIAGAPAVVAVAGGKGAGKGGPSGRASVELRAQEALAKAAANAALKQKVDSMVGTEGKITYTRQATDANRNLTGIETRESGAISMDVVKLYFRSGGGIIYGIILLFLFALEQGARVYTDTWVGNWFGDKYDRSTGFYLGIYFMLGAVYGITTFLRSTTFLFFCVRAAVSIHNQLLDHTLRLPKSFFDTNPAGRILNRFSRDTDIMDSTLSASLIQFAGSVSTYIAILVVITIATYWFGIALVPLTIIYFTIQRYYIPSARELQRIESVTRSPIYSRFGEALQGVATIRAYRLETHFIAASDALMQVNANAFITQKLAAGWLACRLDMIGLAVLTLAGTLCIQGGIDPGMAGLALVYALDLTRFLKHGTNMASKSEADFNSVERIAQYLTPETEARPDTPPEVATTLPADWPSHGAIAVEHLCMRYRPEMPLVLKGVSFNVAPGEKVGLVGRTGSGKSSLLLALFRMVEAESGRITIDGVDIATLGLWHLRSKMSIIPQDPFMFSGSVRHNLDPFDKATDEELWQAVESVGLKPAISALEDKLGAKVVDGGANFSLGQRQLFCLARAMLRKSRVLMLDEATASVDVDTDAQIQSALRLQFGEVTCLTIAHRLNTIMDADRVVVLDSGRVVEDGEPAKLLEKEQGIFTGMVDQTGRTSSRYLKSLARSVSQLRAESVTMGTSRAQVVERIRSLFSTNASFAARGTGIPHIGSGTRLAELVGSGEVGGGGSGYPAGGGSGYGGAGLGPNSPRLGSSMYRPPQLDPKEVAETGEEEHDEEHTSKHAGKAHGAGPEGKDDATTQK